MMSPRLHLRIGQQILADRTRRREGQLVHQQVVADQQGVFHGAGRNDERLHQRGGAGTAAGGW